MPAGDGTGEVASRLLAPAQHDLLLPWAHRYLDEVDRDATAAA